jgi:phage internal scaffolding protein
MPNAIKVRAKRGRSGHPKSGASRTKQSFAKACDINNIMKKYEKTGVLTHVVNSKGLYGDFTQAGDYHAALNSVKAAEENFMALPASIRNQFKNDPGLLLQAMEKAQNGDKDAEKMLVKAGILEKKSSPKVEPPKGGTKPAPDKKPAEPDKKAEA